VFLTTYICTNNLFLLFDKTTGMTHFKSSVFFFTVGLVPRRKLLSAQNRSCKSHIFRKRARKVIISEEK